MKVYITKDERWPDYRLYATDQGDLKDLEIPVELWYEQARVLSKYRDMQTKLSKLYDEAQGE